MFNKGQSIRHLASGKVKVFKGYNQKQRLDPEGFTRVYPSYPGIHDDAPIAGADGTEQHDVPIDEREYEAV